MKKPSEMKMMSFKSKKADAKVEEQPAFDKPTDATMEVRDADETLENPREDAAEMEDIREKEDESNAEDMNEVREDEEKREEAENNDSKGNKVSFLK